jgi:hypothetical protein
MRAKIMPRMTQIFITSEPLQLHVVVSGVVACTARKIDSIKVFFSCGNQLTLMGIVEDYRQKEILPSSLRMIAKQRKGE